MEDFDLTEEELALLVGMPTGRRDRLDEKRKMGRALRERGTMGRGVNLGGYTAAEHPLALLGDLMSRYSGRKEEKKATLGLEDAENDDISRRQMMMQLLRGKHTSQPLASTDEMMQDAGVLAPAEEDMVIPGVSGIDVQVPPPVASGAMPGSPSPAPQPSPPAEVLPEENPAAEMAEAAVVTAPEAPEAPMSFEEKRAADKEKLMGWVKGLRGWNKRRQAELAAERELAQGAANERALYRGY